MPEIIVQTVYNDIPETIFLAIYAENQFFRNVFVRFKLTVVQVCCNQMPPLSPFCLSVVAYT